MTNNNIDIQDALLTHMASSINILFRPGIKPRAVAWQSITLPLRYASSTIKMVQTAVCTIFMLPPYLARNALGLEFGSAAQLSKSPVSVWNCLLEHVLKRSPGIIRKSRVSYPAPGFLSSATWPSLPKKHYNGLNQPIFVNGDFSICIKPMQILVI